MVFDPLPDAPPYFQTPFEDQSFGANAIWFDTVEFLYLTPVVIVGLLIRNVRSGRKNLPSNRSNAD